MLKMETLPNYQQLETYVSGIQKNTVIVLANTSHLASSSFIPNAFCCSVTIYNGESDFHGLLTTAASVNNFGILQNIDTEKMVNPKLLML